MDRQELDQELRGILDQVRAGIVAEASGPQHGGVDLRRVEPFAVRGLAGVVQSGVRRFAPSGVSALRRADTAQGVPQANDHLCRRAGRTGSSPVVVRRLQGVFLPLLTTRRRWRAIR